MGGGLNRDQGEEAAEVSEINVTPFIDVMLVLLIIFMVAAPLATVDINVDLPASGAPQAARPDQPVWVTLQPDLSIAVGDEPVAEDDLTRALARVTDGDTEARLFLRADESVSYGDLMALMNRVRDAGYLKIALVGLEGGS